MSAPPEGEFPHRTYFLITSLGLAAVLVGAAVVTTMGRPDEEELLMQLAALADDAGLYRLGYVIACLVPVLALLLTVGLALLVRPEQWAGSAAAARVMSYVGALLVVAYAPLAVFAFMSQFTILPDKLGENFSTADGWYMGHADSTPCGLAMLAYALFGAGALIIAARLLWERPPLNWAATALGAAGVVDIAAWLFHLVGSDIARPAALIAGLLLLAFALIMALTAWSGQRPFAEAARVAAGDEVAEDGAE